MRTTVTGPFYDAHNHLQDERLQAQLASVVEELPKCGLRRMVVNGTCPGDWSRVLELARQHDWVLPCFGVHPWHVKDLETCWIEILERHLDQVPAGVGEIGLDRWVEGYDFPLQEEVFIKQWKLAVSRKLPVTIHCLKSWGRLLKLLENETHPDPGFLLHSYGGPVEMVDSFVSLGAYFSISGYFAHDRKARQRDVFRQIPADRLLVETDAPDMVLPDEWNRFPLQDPSTKHPINHPANIRSVYEFVAELRGVNLEAMVKQVQANFEKLFRKLLRRNLLATLRQKGTE